MNTRRNNILIILVLVFILLASFGAWLALKPTTSKYDERAPKEAEAGGPSLVILKNSEQLSKLLLPRQFDATKTILDSFIKNTYGENTKNATILNEPLANERGVITLKIQVAEDSAVFFVATIDKWTFYNKLIFSVPEKSYTITVPVYTN